MKLLAQLKRLARRANLRHGLQSPADTMQGLQGWEKTPLAQALFSQQQDQLGEHLGQLFGYHLLELSNFRVTGLSKESLINHRFRLAPIDGFEAGALAQWEALPLESESIDVVILHHVLEFSGNPHQVLREANRVLIPHGHLLILGFNPWSLQGLYKVFAQWLGAGDLWRRRSLRAGRVIDWLQLLDCEPVEVNYGFYRLPINHEGTLRRTGFLESLGQKCRLPFGGYYLLVARKEVGAAILAKPSWKGINPMELVIGKPAGRVSGRQTPGKGGKVVPLVRKDEV
ncbi:class I SAM-dependent methyltransferase [Pseudomaricurvus sp. HS19]|uniref:class I SAM-dependent methyltransferase n=1 Tax=Pseudomaricurvus sp. HS19 TaxID=2692626 RepID=UPI001368884E|nr:methyltransferase domain-containing protein [Pseudomaricurvus sp. HS19]